jgi:hypothetical protein
VALGRPSDFTQEIADSICEQIADGLSLRSICEAENMPNKATVFRWLAAKADFRDQYAYAREAQAETLADELTDIADDGTNDWMERKGEEGQSLGWTENGEAIQRSRLRVDTRKWIASKLKPKKYGDKLAVGGDGDAPPIQTVSEIVIRAVHGNRPSSQSG